MPKPDMTLVSLMEPYQIVKDAFFQYTKAVINQQPENKEQIRRLQENKSLDYSPTEYLMAVVKEIGDTDRNWTEAVSQGVMSPSVMVLMRHGLSREVAVNLNNSVSTQIINTIASVMPDATFGNYENTVYDVVEEMDLMITIHPDYDKDKKE